MVLFIMLHEVVLTFVSVDEILKYNHLTIQSKAIEQVFPVVLFVCEYEILGA